jgi:hypothetical protein
MSEQDLQTAVDAAHLPPEIRPLIRYLACQRLEAGWRGVPSDLVAEVRRSEIVLPIMRRLYEMALAGR